MTNDDLFHSPYRVQVISTAQMAALTDGADALPTTVYRVHLPLPVTEASLINSTYQVIIPGYDASQKRPIWDALLDDLWGEAMRQPHSQVLFLYDVFSIQTVDDAALLAKFIQVMIWAATQAERPHPQGTAKPVSIRTAIACEATKVPLWPDPALQHLA